MVYMSERTVRQASLTTQSLPYGAAGATFELTAEKNLLPFAVCGMLLIWKNAGIPGEVVVRQQGSYTQLCRALQLDRLSTVNGSNYFNYSKCYYNYIAGDDVNW